jgi:Na+-translocating ferredoxin:NAD+ oxidoreductase RnfG subunit
VAVAYFDAGRVRTLPQVLMIVLDPDARVTRIETVSFREPPEYRAPNGWLQQFFGRALNDELSLKGEIANITGATLTAGAVTRATRRVLALHAIVDPFGAHQP